MLKNRVTILSVIQLFDFLYKKVRLVNSKAAIRFGIRASMAQGLFKVGPDAGPQPTRVWHCQKYLRPRRYSPYWGASGVKQLTQPHRKGVKAWWGWPLRPEEISSAEAHPTRSALRSHTASRDATQQLESDTYLKVWS